MRESLKLSQEVLAVKAGLTRATINAAEQGGHLRKNNLQKVACALECTVEYLEGRTDSQIPMVAEQQQPYRANTIGKRFEIHESRDSLVMVDTFTGMSWENARAVMNGRRYQGNRRRR